MRKAKQSRKEIWSNIMMPKAQEGIKGLKVRLFRDLPVGSGTEDIDVFDLILCEEQLASR